jgi:hypothetical protein
LLEQGVTTRPLLVARSQGAPTLWLRSVGYEANRKPDSQGAADIAAWCASLP